MSADPRLALARPRYPAGLVARPEVIRTPARAAVLASCATCWGQRRYLEPARNGEGLVPVECPACLGTGAGWG